MRHLNLLIISLATSFSFNGYSYSSENKNTESDKSTLFSIEKTVKNQNSDSTKIASKKINKEEYLITSQYDKLGAVLEKYKTIERKNLWKKIDINSKTYKELKPFDSSATVKQIRERLFVIGDLKQDSKSGLYDEEMMAGVLNYKKRHGLKLNYKLSLEHINQMNEPISNRIKTLELNMQRLSELPENITYSNEYIIVNIPSYKMFYVKNGKYEFESDVFVGKKTTKTEIFEAMMDKIVFSPYWNIPQSIIENELKLKIASDPNYLEENNMEWNGGRVRQKPGEKNSLGLVKFLFPNPYDIYMHDTPTKSLFQFENRTFSHGCVNLKNAKGLAQAILKNDPDWSEEKINQAMSGQEETPYILKNKIPVYIGYFTAWIDNETGEINFYEDVYDKDTNTEEFQNSAEVVMQ